MSEPPGAAGPGPADTLLARLRRRNRWPLSAYLALVVVLCLVFSVAGVLYLRETSQAFERGEALAAARFGANNAAAGIDETLKVVNQTVAAVAAAPAARDVYAHPERCSLSFGGSGGLTNGHVDLFMTDGSILCSSKATLAGSHAYAAMPWARAGLSAAQFLAPILDPTTGLHTVVSTSPISGLGFAAAFVSLENLGTDLFQTYGGEDGLEFLVLNPRDGSILSRSINPSKWIGRSAASTPFGSPGSPDARPDVQGTPRFYGLATVRSTGWMVYAGGTQSAALASSDQLFQQQLVLVVAGIGVLLLGVMVVYRGIARPIRELGIAVRAAAASPGSVIARPPSRVRGPTEVTGLGRDFDRVMAAVSGELQLRLATEESLRQSERNYRTIFETNPEAMWVYELGSLRFLDVNLAAIQLYGYSREEFLSMTMRQFWRPQDVPEMLERAASGRLFDRSGPWLHLTKDGVSIQVEVNSHPIFFGGREARAVMADDITARAVADQRLRQSQRLESLGQLAGGVAHDFNNLLSVILNYLTFVKEAVVALPAATTPGAQAISDDLDQAERAALRAAELTQQLLAFGRREVVRPESIVVNDRVGQFEQLLSRTLGADVNLVTNLRGGAWPVMMDPGQFEQVLLNLALNARDAMKTGGRLLIETDDVEISEYVGASPGLQPGRYVRLRVSDNGAGMSPEVVDRAFEPFFTTKPRGEGTGLGLATVHGIVAQAGGAVHLYSEPGLGTSVSVLIPATDQVAAAPAPPAQPAGPAGAHTILVVEDEASLRDVTQRILERRGYKVLAAADGETAVQLANDHPGPIDLLLTDVIMPGMPGRDVAKNVTQVRPGIGVIFVSGYAQPILTSEGRLDDGVTLLEKPFSETALIGKVMDLLGDG